MVSWSRFGIQLQNFAVSLRTAFLFLLICLYSFWRDLTVMEKEGARKAAASPKKRGRPRKEKSPTKTTTEATKRQDEESANVEEQETVVTPKKRKKNPAKQDLVVVAPPSVMDWLIWKTVAFSVHSEHGQEIVGLGRFRQLRAVLHANDNKEDEKKKDTLKKIRLLLNTVKATFPAYLDVGDEMTLDEATVASRSKYGRHLIFYQPTNTLTISQWGCGKITLLP